MLTINLLNSYTDDDDDDDAHWIPAFCLTQENRVRVYDQHRGRVVKSSNLI